MTKHYIPARNHIIWLDYKPSKGREIGKYRPTLVLSSKQYNQQTGLLIACLISTSIRSGITEVPVDNLDKPSVVAASLVQTLSWRERKAKYIATAENDVLEQVLQRLLPLMGAENLLKK